MQRKGCKIKKLISSILLIGCLSGCTGIVTGHQYTIEDVEKSEKAYLKVKDEYLKYKDTKEIQEKK